MTLTLESLGKQDTQALLGDAFIGVCVCVVGVSLIAGVSSEEGALVGGVVYATQKERRAGTFQGEGD